ncbi:MAG: hypothetical protein BRD28_04530 [Bacteroidetes bacterium QH_10_64_37]|nr:MAG: hypothetical protein BRD28_04530 [Bacteroidetes bacterium QH_10_64_37]
MNIADQHSTGRGCISFLRPIRSRTIDRTNPTPPSHPLNLERPPSQAVLPPVDAQVRGAALLAPIALLSIGPHLALWGLPGTPFPFDSGSILLFCGAFVLGVLFHEGLHGLGHVRGEASWSDVRFGMHWKALTPFAQCTVPTRTRSYRIAIALPGLVLGAGPLVLGLATGIWLLTFYGFLMLVAAAGDLLILWVLRGVPAGAWVQDHPRQVGCLVVAGAEDPAPPAVSEEDVPAGATDGDKLSFAHLLFLAAFSAVCAAVGFLIALW